jgi:hypothetical protein
MPVIVIPDLVIAADLLTVSVNVLVEVVGLGDSEAVTPFGRPLTIKSTF